MCSKLNLKVVLWRHDDMLWLWVKVLRPTQHKIGPFRDILRSHSLALVLQKLNLRKSKHSSETWRYSNTSKCKKLKPSLVASYDLQPGSRAAIFYSCSSNQGQFSHWCLPNAPLWNISLAQITRCHISCHEVMNSWPVELLLNSTNSFSCASMAWQKRVMGPVMCCDSCGHNGGQLEAAGNWSKWHEIRWLRNFVYFLTGSVEAI